MILQWSGRFALTNVRGLNYSVDLDATRFVSDPLQTLQPNARRGFALLQVSRLAGSGQVHHAKLQLHAAAYQYRPRWPTGARCQQSVVPTLSLDSGLVFERDVRLWGHDLVRTLGPRAFYVYTPYRNQVCYPITTALNDFNCQPLHGERLYRARQDFRQQPAHARPDHALSGCPDGRSDHCLWCGPAPAFEDQRVTLDASSQPAQQGFNDIMLGASLNLDERWMLGSPCSPTPKTDQSERSVLGLRYNPARTASSDTAYRSSATTRSRST